MSAALTQHSSSHHFKMANALAPSSLPSLSLPSIMASSCHFHGVIGISNGRSFNYAPKKTFWKHDGVLPLQAGDLSVDLFTFGGNPAPLDEGLYSGVARAVTRLTAEDHAPRLELYANEEFLPAPPVVKEDEEDGARMPPPVFFAAGKACRSEEQRKSFDIDISQYAATNQQLIRLHCVYPLRNQRFAKTPLPDVGKHVVVLGSLTGFAGARAVIHVKDIAFGPSESIVGSDEHTPLVKGVNYDWSKGKRKRTKREEDDLPVPSTSRVPPAEDAVAG